MILERNKSNRPILTEELIEYVCNEYLKGRSITSIKDEIKSSPNVVSKILKDNGVTKRTPKEMATKFIFNEDYFSVIDTEEKAYWLGFLSADGYITKQRKHCSYRVGVSLAIFDKEHLNKLKNALNSNHEIKVYRNSEKNEFGQTEYCRLIFSSNKFANDLIEKGCVPNKSDILQYMGDIVVPKEYEIDYIRGYFDGNGSISFTDKTKKLSLCGTKEMLQGFLTYFNYNIKMDKRRDNGTNNYSISFTHRKAYGILKQMYENSHIYLDRKYEKYLEFKKLYDTEA